MKKQSTQKPSAKSRSAPQQKKAKSNPKPKPKPKVGGPRLSQCATDYARCLVNPFTGPLACVPNFPALKSRKFRVWAKGTLSTGSAGIGFLWQDPQLGINNDVDSVLYTTNTFPGNSFTVAGGGEVIGAATNSDYTSSQISASGITYRVVSSGIRVRYISTELNRGGQIVALSDTNHNSLIGRTIQDLDAEINSKRFPVNREWTTVTMRPVRDGDDEFGTNPAGAPTDASQIAWYQGIMIQSPGVDVDYEWESYTVYEAQGANVRGMTPSHVDPNGYASVNAMTNFTKHLDPHQKKPAEVEKSAVDDTLKILGTTMSIAGPLATGTVDLLSGNIPGAVMNYGEAIFELFD
jgi:hypothetical protein